MTALTRRSCFYARAELSMGWVAPWVGFGWFGLGRDFSVFRGLGWVHYSNSTEIWSANLALSRLTDNSWVGLGPKFFHL